MKLSTDFEMFKVMRERLYSSVISDILDRVGFKNQAMEAEIRPLFPEAVLVGRALTVLSVDVYHEPTDPYLLEIESVDSLKPNDVLVASTNKSKRTCFWGELLSTAAKARGASGAVIDGYTRDVKRIVKMKFPVFARGVKPVNSYGRSVVINYNVPLECGGVLVNPGEIVFGDIDGVVVIPRAVESQVVEKALEKVGAENKTREELKKGAHLRDVYQKYHVL